MTFSNELRQWYRSNKRDLPWRQTTDPYRVWLSEIILQQTRVDQGISYYRKFVRSFPDVHHLAKASEDQVLKLWQGLGYYSRARNLHATAKLISSHYNGKFPGNYTELLNLKGIGPYTAAAIASFCFDEPRAVVDGNVYRVISRIFGLSDFIDTPQGKRIFQQKANELLDTSNPGEHNQAIMEFGAIHCTPRTPNCNSCPFNKVCVALQTESIAGLPQKSKKQKVKEVFFNYLVFRSQEHLWIKKREGNGIWQNLYDFPMMETDKAKENSWVARESSVRYGNEGELKPKPASKEYTHLLSHRKIHARFFIIQSTPEPSDSEKLIKIHKSEIGEYAVPRLIENFLDDHPELL